VGRRAITEDEAPTPSAWGRCLAPVLDRLDGYIAAGLPILTALPGWAYGNASWFRDRVVEPVMTGRRVLQFGRTGPWVSPIHVDDCARALVHLAEHGEPGGRYFLVNSDRSGCTSSRVRSRAWRSVPSACCGCPPPRRDW
jgi:nucleoside-diphosphate-sugar epimerase